MEKENLFKKRARSENWLEEDKLLLRDLVKERVKDIENKNTDSNTNTKKIKAWADLLLSFNGMCKGNSRTLKQVKSQWGTQKMDEKKKRAQERRELNKTGGGPAPPLDPNDPEDIGNWLPNEFTVDTCDHDSDYIHQVWCN